MCLLTTVHNNSGSVEQWSHSHSALLFFIGNGDLVTVLAGCDTLTPSKKHFCHLHLCTLMLECFARVYFYEHIVSADSVK